MRDSLETNGGLFAAMIASAVLAGPVLGLWPLVGVIAAIGTSVYITNSIRRR
jgi:hypothetical protein